MNIHRMAEENLYTLSTQSSPQSSEEGHMLGELVQELGFQPSQSYDKTPF